MKIKAKLILHMVIGGVRAVSGSIVITKIFGMSLSRASSPT